MARKVLVIAAHPDDEALGCGGTMARHVKEGDDVHVVFTADGVGARGDTKGMEARYDMARKAAKMAGAKEPKFLGFPDNQMDGIQLLKITQEIEKIIADIKPQVVYTHHHGDLNIDHVVTARAVMTACRPLPGSSVQEIYGFEVLSSTEWAPVDAFMPTHFVNIEKFYAQKTDMLKAYDAEMRPHPHARSYESAEALATLRGGQSGFKKAEGFTVLRNLRS